MNPKTSKFILVGLNLLAIPIIWYVIHDFSSVSDAILQNDPVVAFDTGKYYLLLISVFWLFSAMQMTARRSGKAASFIEKRGSIIVIGWFIGIIILANLVPNLIQNKSEANKYFACADKTEVSRLSLGRSIVYSKTRCDLLQLGIDKAE